MTDMEEKVKSYIPQYVKIQNYILSRINSGELKAGDKIPSENEIAHMFSVSRVTANTAIKELTTMGVINRIKGKGSFVSNTNRMPTTANVFSGSVKIKTDDSPVKEHQVASIRLFKPLDDIYKKFSVDPEETFFEIIRLINHNDKVKYVDYTYIPSKYIKNHMLLSEELGNTYIHDYLKSHCVEKPSKIKIFLNVPLYPYLDLSYIDKKDHDNLYIWDTNIYNDSETLLASTTTVAPNMSDDAFISFSL